MKGRVRKLRNLNRILAVFDGKDWMRNCEIWAALKKMMPDLQIDKRTWIRYLNTQVKMGNLEKLTEPGKTRYRLSNEGGMMRLASIIQASMMVQSDVYPDLQKGSIVLEIKKNQELFALLIVPQEDMRIKLAEKWKDKEWGKTITRPIIHFIYESLQPKPAFAEKIPGTELFFFKPPPKLNEMMTSAVLSGDYEAEAGIIMHAMNDWGELREKGRFNSVSLAPFPCVRNAVDKGIFKTPKEAMVEALKNLEAQLRRQATSPKS